MVLATSGRPDKKESVELLHHPSNPLDHLKKVFHGFCDPRSAVSPEDDDDDEDHNGRAATPRNATEPSRSVEHKKAALERSVDAIPVHPPNAMNSATQKEEEEMEVILQPVNTKYEELIVMRPINPSVTSSTESVASSSDDNKEPLLASKSQQTIPVRAHRYPYLMETTFFTCALLMFTLVTLLRMGIKLDFEFTSKMAGNNPSSNVFVINDMQGEQSVRPSLSSSPVLPEDVLPDVVEVDMKEIELMTAEAEDIVEEAGDEPDIVIVTDDVDSQTGPSVELASDAHVPTVDEL